MEFRDAIQDYSEQPITKQILLSLLKDYKRPYDKINELMKQGVLVAIKRGIYVPGTNQNIPRPDPFLLANHLLGPSYVSMESALSHWGLIPERVYEISSMTIQSSKIYKTAVGTFSYTHTSLPYYSYGIQQLELTKRQTALVASPEKALCDKIITTSGVLLRSEKQVRTFLVDDLRMEAGELRQLNVKEINSWVINAPKKSSLTILVKTLKML